MKALSLFSLVGALIFISSSFAQPGSKVKVLVWDEQQPEGSETYSKHIGEYMVDRLKKNPSLEVKSNNLFQPENGLSTKDLDEADVLIYWAHRKNDDVSELKAQEIAEMVKSGKLAFVALHSAHWAKPFMVCMQEKAAQDALERLSADDRKRAEVIFKGNLEHKKPGLYDRNFLEVSYRTTDSGKIKISVERPHCVFPRCCTPVQPSQIRVIHHDHPIVQGVADIFTIDETEMYDDPFGIPEPDYLILDESWQGGEYFRSGILWNLGLGKVFYFRPGHETYPVYTNEQVMKIIENAALWMGTEVQKNKH